MFTYVNVTSFPSTVNILLTTDILGYLQLGSENIAHDRHRTGQTFLLLPRITVPPNPNSLAWVWGTYSFHQPNFEPTVHSTQGPRELLSL